MAASLARGETILVNAAREPEVQDLARCLVAMGAKIDGIGSDTITVQGSTACMGPNILSCRTELKRGPGNRSSHHWRRIDTRGAELTHLESFATHCARQASISRPMTEVRVAARNGRVTGVDAMTEPYPGFPTDLQAQFMALMTVADGAAMVTETIFENRFMHVPELARMGANVTLHGGSALVRGVGRLTGAPVMATDLRASVSLSLPVWPRRARQLSTASTTLIGVTNVWRKNSPHAVQRLSGFGIEGGQNAHAGRKREQAEPHRCDAPDLAVMSSMLQDAIVLVADMVYLERNSPSSW